MTTSEAAAELGVSEQAVRQAIARGALAAAKRGRGWQIRHDELDRYAQRRRRLQPSDPGNAASAPPAQAVVSTVPVPASRFVGREADLTALIARLKQPDERIVTLTGPGGVGKTRLALAAASAVGERFPEGVYFVDLAPVTRLDLVATTLAHALALHEQPGGELLTQLADFLRGKRVLLILDNFEHILDAAPQIAWLVARAPATTMLITSRAPLRIGGERVLPVPPLSLANERAGTEAGLASDAARLFLERAREHDPRFVVDDTIAPIVTDICARLDGLPLAIELAAAWAKVLAPTVLRDRLGLRLPLLERGARDAPSRQQTMRDTISWSHDLLTLDQRRAFRSMAVFAGAFSLDAAGDVWGASDSDETENNTGAILDLLSSLVEQSLLVLESGPAGEPRFRMLETIREFGRAQLDAGEADALHAAHAGHYMRLVTKLRPLMETLATREPIDRLAADGVNVAQALSWLDEHGRAADVARMVASCKIYWYAIGRLSEAERWILRARSTIGEAAPGDQALLAIAQGELLMVTGDVVGAERYLTEGESLLREAGDLFDLTMGLVAFGAALNYGGKYTLAADRLREGLSLAEQIPDATLRAAFVSDALRNLSVSARGEGDPDLAAAHCDEALRRLGGLGLALAEHRVQMTKCGIAKDRGDMSSAVAGYRSLLGEIGEQGEAWVGAAALAGIAHAAAAWRQPRAAVLLIGAADSLRERCGAGLVLPSEAAEEDRDRQALRAEMGDSEFEAALAEGRALSLADAVAVVQAIRNSARQATPRGAPGEALTRREQQVLALLAAGQTDREIADRLFLSRAQSAGMRVPSLPSWESQHDARRRAKHKPEAGPSSTRKGGPGISIDSRSSIPILAVLDDY